MHSIIQILDEATGSAGPDLISLEFPLASIRDARSLAFAARGPTT